MGAECSAPGHLIGECVVRFAALASEKAVWDARMAAWPARGVGVVVGLRIVRSRPPSLKVMPHEFERRLLAAAAL